MYFTSHTTFRIYFKALKFSGVHLKDEVRKDSKSFIVYTLNNCKLYNQACIQIKRKGKKDTLAARHK